jgi:hypothetical protein
VNNEEFPILEEEKEGDVLVVDEEVLVKRSWGCQAPGTSHFEWWLIRMTIVFTHLYP